MLYANVDSLKLLKQYLHEVLGTVDPWSTKDPHNLYMVGSYQQPVSVIDDDGGVLEDEEQEDAEHQTSSVLSRFER